MLNKDIGSTSSMLIVVPIIFPQYLLLFVIWSCKPYEFFNSTTSDAKKYIQQIANRVLAIRSFAHFLNYIVSSKLNLFRTNFQFVDKAGPEYVISLNLSSCTSRYSPLLCRIRAVRFNEYHPRVEMGFSAGGVKMCVPPDTGITGGGKRAICIHETIQDCRRNKYWTSDF